MTAPRTRSSRTLASGVANRSASRNWVSLTWASTVWPRVVSRNCCAVAMRARPQVTVSIGAVSIPIPTLLAGGANQDVLDEIRALAVTAMTQARTAGGNQIRQIIEPVLTTLHDDHPGNE